MIAHGCPQLSCSENRADATDRSVFLIAMSNSQSLVGGAKLAIVGDLERGELCQTVFLEPAVGFVGESADDATFLK